MEYKINRNGLWLSLVKNYIKLSFLLGLSFGVIAFLVNDEVLCKKPLDYLYGVFIWSCFLGVLALITMPLVSSSNITIKNDQLYGRSPSGRKNVIPLKRIIYIYEQAWPIDNVVLRSSTHGEIMVYERTKGFEELMKIIKSKMRKCSGA